MKKQWLSIVLVLCMVLCMAPTTARAAESKKGTLAITVNVWGLDEGDDAGGKTFSFEIRRKYGSNYGHYKNVDITIAPGETAHTEDVPVEAGTYTVEQTSHATIDGYDFKSVAYALGSTGVLEVYENRSTAVTVNNHYKKAETNEITALPIKINGYALGAKVSDIEASTEDQMRVAITKVTVKQSNGSGGWVELAPDATIQADTQYAVEIFVNAKKAEYTYDELKPENVTVNGKTASEFEKDPSTQPGGDMRVFHELDVLKVVKKVDHIKITKEPDKTTYNAGDKFEPAGMVVTAVYKDGTSEPITNYSIFHGDKLTKGQEYVTIQYNDGSGSSNIKTYQPITVGPYVGDHQHTYDGSPWYQDAQNHWHQCTDKDCPDPSGSTKDLARHTFVWKVDTAATRTQTGSKHEECTVCHYKRNENTEIPVLSGHRPATRPDSGTENTVITSAKTGDAGIALYAGLSLLALSGSGWAVGKKRRGEK